MHSIPVDDLASNGESVRAKVFHIACALCSQIGASETDQELIRDWCNMVSVGASPTHVAHPPSSDSRWRVTHFLLCGVV